jgi:hypothetical protein
MKLQVLAATVAALALAGVAVAQPSAPPYVEGPGGTSPPRTEYQQTFRTPGGSSQADINHRRSYSNLSASADYRQKVVAYRMACASDRTTLCHGRNSANAVYECLRIRRSKLSEPCRAATYAVERAAADAL